METYLLSDFCLRYTSDFGLHLIVFGSASKTLKLITPELKKKKF